MNDSKNSFILWYNRIVPVDSKYPRTVRKCHTWYCAICKSRYYSARLVTRVELPDHCPTCSRKMKYFRREVFDEMRR